MAVTVQELLIEISATDKTGSALSSADRGTLKLAEDTDKLIGIMKRGDVQGAKVAASLEKIRDKTLRAKAATKAFKNSLKANNGMLNRFSDRVSAANAKLASMGALGSVIKAGAKLAVAGLLALAASATAVVAAVAVLAGKSMRAFIKSTKEGKVAADGLAKSWDKLQQEFGRAILDGDPSSSVLSFTKLLDDLTRAAKENDKAIRETFVAIVDGVEASTLSLIGFWMKLGVGLATWAEGLRYVFSLLAKKLPAFVERVATLANSTGAISDKLLGKIRRVKGESDEWLKTQALVDYAQGVRDVSASFEELVTRVADAATAANGALSTMTGNLDDVLQGRTTPKKRSKEAIARRKKRLAEEKALTKKLAAEAKRRADAISRGLIAGKTVAQIKFEFIITNLDDVPAAIAAAEKLRELDKAAIELKKKMTAAMTRRVDMATVGSVKLAKALKKEATAAEKKAAADAKIDASNMRLATSTALAAAALSDMFVSLAAGQEGIAKAAAAMISSVGVIVGNLGKAVLIASLGLAALFEGNPAAGIAFGIGMIAVGALLQRGGAALGRDDAESKATSSDAVSNSSSRDLSTQLNAFDKRKKDGEGSVVNVFIGQDQIRGPIRNIVGDMARRGQVPELRGAF